MTKVFILVKIPKVIYKRSTKVSPRVKRQGGRRIFSL